MFTAQSETNVTILMLAGGVFAVVGLWLLIKPKPSSGAAKIELFGMKFESSSAGVLVFLIGAAFLSIPLFADVKERADVTETGGPKKAATPAVAASQVKDPMPSTEALMLPPGPDTAEKEPNDSLRQSNQIAVGSIVSGVAAYDSSDWFVVPTPFEAHRKLEVKLSTYSNWVRMEIFDYREEKAAELSASREADYGEVSIGQSDRLYLRVFGQDDTKYELSTRLLEDN